MDDILKRMIAVEKEAEAIVESAEAESREIMSQARKRVNELESAEQTSLTAAYEEVLSKELSAAESKRKSMLSGAESELSRRESDFRKKIGVHQAEVTRCLLGMDI